MDKEREQFHADLLRSVREMKLRKPRASRAWI